MDMKIFHIKTKIFQVCVAAVCLLSVAAALPSKLGGHGHGHGHRAVQRQARQGGAETGYLAARQEPEQPAYNGWVTIFFYGWNIFLGEKYISNGTFQWSGSGQ